MLEVALDQALDRAATMLPRGTVPNGYGRLRTGSKLAEFVEGRAVSGSPLKGDRIRGRNHWIHHPFSQAVRFGCARRRARTLSTGAGTLDRGASALIPGGLDGFEAAPTNFPDTTG